MRWMLKHLNVGNDDCKQSPSILLVPLEGYEGGQDKDSKEGDKDPWIFQQFFPHPLPLS